MSPSFSKAGEFAGPFGRNEFLRSTHGMKEESRTFAKDAIPLNDQSGTPNMKVLQPGTVIAKITTGPNAGKFGVFQAAGVAEVQTLTPSGTWTSTGGTYTISDSTGDSVEVPVADTHDQVAALVQGLDGMQDYVVTATGGPLGSAAIVFTITGDDIDADVPALAFAKTNVTGGTSPNAQFTTTTAGSPGSSDGRSTLANIVGLNKTLVAWQLLYEDYQIAVIYECSAVQGWCIEYNAAGDPVPLSNTTAAAMQRGGAAGKSVDISWH